MKSLFLEYFCKKIFTQQQYLTFLTTTNSDGSSQRHPFLLLQVMWVCNLCRKQQEILTKSGAWFYGSGPDQVRGVYEGGPQGKKAKLQDPTPASDRSRPHRQASLDNGSGLRYSGPGDAPLDRSVLLLLWSFEDLDKEILLQI